jgi:hypothetical protein
VECRTPLATLRHLFLTPARKFEFSKKKWEQKNLGAKNKIWEQKKHFWEMSHSLSKCRTQKPKCDVGSQGSKKIRIFPAAQHNNFIFSFCCLPVKLPGSPALTQRVARKHRQNLNPKPTQRVARKHRQNLEMM